MLSLRTGTVAVTRTRTVKVRVRVTAAQSYVRRRTRWGRGRISPRAGSRGASGVDVRRYQTGNEESAFQKAVKESLRESSAQSSDRGQQRQNTFRRLRKSGVLSRVKSHPGHQRRQKRSTWSNSWGNVFTRKWNKRLRLMSLLTIYAMFLRFLITIGSITAPSLFSCATSPCEKMKRVW